MVQFFQSSVGALRKALKILRENKTPADLRFGELRIQGEW